MNPLGPTPERPVVGIPGYVVWRGLIVIAILLAGGSLALAPYLYNRGTNAISANRDTLCGIGSFLTGAPVIRNPTTSRATFVGQLVATRAFLNDLRKLQCEGGFGAGVTVKAIEEELRAINRKLKAERAFARRHRVVGAARGLQGSTPAKPKPPGSTVIASAPSSPATTTAAPAPPPPTTTTTPPPPPGGPPSPPPGGGNPPPPPPPGKPPPVLGPVLDPIVPGCHISLAGIRVC